MDVLLWIAQDVDIWSGNGRVTVSLHVSCMLFLFFGNGGRDVHGAYILK